MLEFQRSPRVLCSACYRFGCRVDDIICLIHSRHFTLFTHCWHRCRVFEFPRVVPFSLIKHENWLPVVVHNGRVILWPFSRTHYSVITMTTHNEKLPSISLIAQFHNAEIQIMRSKVFSLSCTRLCPVIDTIPRLIWMLTFPPTITITIKQPLFFFIFGAIRSQIKKCPQRHDGSRQRNSPETCCLNENERCRWKVCFSFSAESLSMMRHYKTNSCRRLVCCLCARGEKDFLRPRITLISKVRKPRRVSKKINKLAGERKLQKKSIGKSNQQFVIWLRAEKLQLLRLQVNHSFLGLSKLKEKP